MSWDQQAACRDHQDDMHPDKAASGIVKAKSICARCPVWVSCLVDAIRVGDNEWGIRGGLKPGERQKVAANLTDTQLDDRKAVEDAVQLILHPRTGHLTLADLWDKHAYVMAGGHMGWQGAGSTGSITWQGRTYTPKQIAFQVDRGRAPEGQVRRTCPVIECVHPRHITDGTERAATQQTAAAA